MKETKGGTEFRPEESSSSRDLVLFVSDRWCETDTIYVGMEFVDTALQARTSSADGMWSREEITNLRDYLTKRLEERCESDS